MLLLRRWTCLILVFLMLLGMLPVSALATDLPQESEVAVEQVLEEETPVETAQPEEVTESTEATESVETVEPVEAEEEILPLTEEESPAFDLARLVKLELRTLPKKTTYQVGTALNLAGIGVYAEDEQGASQILGAENLTVLSGDTSVAGIRKITVGVGSLRVSFDVIVHTLHKKGEFLQDSEDYPESDHNYSNYADEHYTYTCPGAEYLKLTFSQNTQFESNCDWLYIYDGKENLLESYTSNVLAGKTITIQGDTVVLNLTSDGSVTRYGFSLDAVYAYVDVPVHEAGKNSVYTAPLCFVNAYTTHTCWICGETWMEEHPDTAAHVIDGGFCQICGLPQNATAQGKLNDTIAWAITQENVLYLAGSGATPDNVSWDTSLSAVTTLVVGNGITRLGDGLFTGCTGIQEVQLPDTLEEIGNNAFYGCTGLTSLTLNAGLESIGSNALRNCKALTMLYIPGSVVTISASGYSSSPFYGCSSNLAIYCQAIEKQEGWGAYWNYYSSGGVLPTNYGFTPEDVTFWSELDKTAAVITIPEGISAIPNNAFYNCTNLTSITLPQSLKTIGSYAFYGCSNLAEIKIPNGVQVIGNYAFQKCTSLTEMKLPGSLTTLGHSFLSGAKRVKEITFPAKLVNFPADSSYGVLSGSSVEKVIFADGITAIGSYVLYNCSTITHVTIPKSVTSIGTYAFARCSKLETVDLPAGLEELGARAFQNCTALKAVTISGTVAVIGEYTFSGCSKLENVVLPAGLTQIGDYAFDNCTALVSINLPDSVVRIGNYAFNKCSKMNTALPAKLEEVGNYAFYKCAALVDVQVPAAVQIIGNYAFSECTGLTAVNLAGNQTTIGNYVFNGCKNLASVTLPKGLTSLGYSVFYGCSSLTELYLPGSITTMNRSGNSGPLDGSGITKVVFGDGFTTIPDYALSGYATGTSTYASRITEVVFEAPEKITKIGKYAFYNCGALTTAPIPSGVTAIDSYAFAGCTSLPSVTLPQGLTELGYGVFYGSFALTELYLPGTITTMSHSGNSGALDGSGITKVVFGDGFTAIPDYALSSSNTGTSTYASRITQVVFEAPEKITRLGNRAFQNCGVLESIVLPSGTTEMGEYVFYGCSALKTLDIPKGVTQIGYASFYRCRGLEQIKIPDTVTAIGNNAFYECTALETVEIGSGCNVGYQAFYNCTALKYLTIGDNSYIQRQAFGRCSALESVIMGSNVQMESDAFYGAALSGELEGGFTWALDLDTRVLTLQGSGKLHDFTQDAPAPWKGFASLVTYIDFGTGITAIGSNAFVGCTSLDAVVLPEGIQNVAEDAFAGCTGISYIEISDGVKYIGKNAFSSAALDSVVFLGDAPVLEDNCFGTGETQVFYPETASGFIARIFEKFVQYVWTEWDDTIPNKDVVILLDTSGSMAGKEDTLSDASSQLIRAIGGAMKKTNISVVEYESNPSMLCDFTTNVYRLTDAVAELEASGGTEYKRALLKAQELIQSRSQDIPFVIMFSDGEPNDNTSAIYALAEEMRQQGIVIYTVGLLSSSSQRKVLINVAGDESRYFEATNIAGLVAAFMELSENFGKNEYATVEMKIGDKRHDIFNEPYTLCLSSDIPISFYFTTGTNAMYDDVQTIAIEQNDQYVLSNTTGVFEDIIPGDYFRSGKPVCMVMLDGNGNVVERKQLLLEFTDTYTIRYLMGPAMDNVMYLEEEFIPGDEICAPAEPTRVGFNFAGWYASENCEGVDFFTVMAQIGTGKLTESTVLYAKWDQQDSELNLGVDTWTFGNYPSNFNCTHYEMTVNDVARLFQTATESEKAFLDDVRHPKDEYGNPSWGGSCFGMSASVLLSYFGDLSISNFPENGTSGKTYRTIGAASLLQNTNGDTDVGAIESMINFYQVRQVLGAINAVRTNFTKHWNGTDSENLKRIIQKMETANAPVLMTINLVRDTNSYGGHAVVAYDLEEFADHYTFKVYDCSQFGTKNNPINYTVDVEVAENGTYSASCDAWEAAWSNYNYIFFKTAMTAEELKALPILTAPNAIQARSLGASTDVAGYTLMTSYGDFTISDGTSSAVISKGIKVSGDLSIDCHGKDNDIETADTYRFTLPELAEGSTYTITQSGSSGYKTSLIYLNAQDGFYVTHAAVTPGSVMIGEDGSIASQYTGAVEQELNATHNNLSTPWYTVKVTGESAGLKLAPQADAVAVIASEDAVVDIVAKSDFNSVTLNDVQVGAGASEIKDNNGNCVVVQNEEIIAGEVYGYSVAFNSGMGTSVPTLTNVPHGSLVTEPTDPTKTGYIFQGWFIDETYTELWDFANDVVTEDTILYAGWSLDPNYLKAVTFRVPGQEDQIVYVPKGDVIPSTYAPLDKTGKALLWYTNATYTSKEWNFETDVISSDITLYGKTDLCMVSYVTGNGQQLADSKLYSGMTIPVPTGLVMEGYTLCGWYTDANLNQVWNFAEDRLETDTILYAKWLPNEVDKNGSDTGICIEILNEDSYIYTGKAIKPDIVVWDDGNILIPNVDYTVSYSNNINARSKDDTSVAANRLPQVIVQGKGNYQATKRISKTFTIHQVEMKDLQVTLPSFVACLTNNRQQTVRATVTNGTSTIAASYYTISYYTDAELTQSVKGITEPGMYYLVLEAKMDKKGNYTGNYRGATEAFLLDAVPAEKALTNAKITTPWSITAVFTKLDPSQAIPALITKVNLNRVDYLTTGENLEAFTELFEVTAIDADGTEISQEDLGLVLMSVGKKTIVVRAKENNPLGLKGEKTATVTIKGAPLNKKQFQVTFDQSGATTVTKTEFTGTAQVPTIITQLRADVDYTVSYKSGTKFINSWQVKDATNYTMVITGKGAYSGSLSYSFSITKVDIAKAYAAGNIKISSPGQSVYTPNGVKVPLVASYTNQRGTRISMVEGVDYSLSFSGNRTVTENASITIQGRGNYSGTLNKTKAAELVYSVTPKDIGAGGISVTVNGLTMRNGQVTGVRYTVYHAGKTVATKQYTGQVTESDDDTVTLLIEGKGLLYTGSRSVKITKTLISASSTKQVKMSLVEQKFYYTGSTIRPQVVITDGEGNDISACFSITYGENTKVGAGTITVTGKPDMGYYGSKILRFTILPKWSKWIFG